LLAGQALIWNDAPDVFWNVDGEIVIFALQTFNMANLKPFEIKEKVGIVGGIVLLTAILGLLLKWKGFYDFIVPEGNWLNWRFVIILALSVGLIVWFVMNALWKKEYENHIRTSYDRDNMKDQLSIYEKKLMTDVTTGLPNGTKLIEDIKELITSRKARSTIQVILIDIKSFGSINKKHGFLVGDELLRKIAQSIYKSIRRNENMYMPPLDEDLWKNVYRRYPGGDEFVFLVRGDQSAAIGFVVNRLVPEFTDLSETTKELLGVKLALSFHCAIVEAAPGMSPDTVFAGIGKCYARATEGKKDYNICWYPNDVEETLDEKDYRKNFYAKAYKTFDVMTLKNLE
jgi:diguanylate cyclase (GGDEF)-like protein